MGVASGRGRHLCLFFVPCGHRVMAIDVVVLKVVCVFVFVYDV